MSPPFGLILASLVVPSLALRRFMNIDVPILVSNNDLKTPHEEFLT